MMGGRIGMSFVTSAVLAAACSGGSGNEIGSIPSQAAPTSTEAPFIEPVETDAVTTTTAPIIPDGPLGEVCGDSIVVQASSFPGIGAGPLYALLGANPTVEPDRQAVSAPLTRADGTVEAVTLEIRSGGPAVGFRSPIVVMADDDTVDLALASTAVAVRDRSVLETVAVITLTDRSRDSVIIDPATYPDVTDLGSLGAQDVPVRHVTDAPVIAFLSATEILTADQLEPGSDGLPATFIEQAGTMTQQGDLAIEPALYPTLQPWGRPVTALPAFEAGWASLDDMLVVDAGADRLADECLGRLVRVIQQSIVAYVADPNATNTLLSDVRAQFNPLTRLTPALFDLGTLLAIDAGVFDTSLESAAGSIPVDGLDEFLGELARALDVEPVTSDQLIDPRFIDPTISR